MIVLAVIGWVAAPGLAAPPARPNILFILADDFGYELVGANGGESYSTPNLDRLAAGGMRFERCYSQPLCTPTRVQLLTGLYNQRNYVRFAHLDPAAATFAQLLKGAGYRTCIAGKWQLAGGADAPRRFGFDEHLLWQLTVRRARYSNPVLEREGKVIEYRNGEYGPDLVCDFLIDFMRRHRDGPFLAFYPMLLTHAPFEPTPDSAGWDPKSAGAEGGGSDPKHFPAMVRYADKLVGKMVAALDDLGIRERTLLLFTGDNGTARAIVSRWRGREVRGGKGLTHAGGTHVPLIASWPGVVPAGAVCRDLIDATDFLPTLLEAAGLPLPAGFSPDGRSFLPQLRGQRGKPREWTYSWYSRDGGPDGVESAFDGRFKLYRDGRFFDVDADRIEGRALPLETLPEEAGAARRRLVEVLESFRGTRRAAAASERPPSPQEAAEKLRALGAEVSEKEGKVVEVLLNRFAITGRVLDLVSALPDLTDLSLEDTAFDDAAAARVAGLEKLEWLNLFRTRIGDDGLAALARLKSLKQLPIGGTRVTDAGLKHLAAMTQLEYLGLRGNRITDAGIEQVAGLAELQGLHLGETAVSAAGLKRLAALERLEKLWLDGTAIGDEAIEALSALRRLRELHLRSTRFSDGGLRRLREALPRCTVEER
jgi:arylsulfatase A